VHVDETSQRVAGRTAWVHVVSTTLLTFYAHHAKRGREAVDAIGLRIGFAGRRVHDLAPGGGGRCVWTPYLSPAGLYALCNVHLLRDLMGVCQGTGQAWAQQLIWLLLLRMKTAVETVQAAEQTELPAKQRAGFEAAYTRLLNEGLLANPPSPPILTGKRGRTKPTPARNLPERLTPHRSATSARAKPSRSEAQSRVAFAAPKAPPSAAAFAATFRHCASKASRSLMGSPAFSSGNRSCPG